ncbi:MAG: anthranilate synthase component I family protein, partial [Bacteroidota bacterium]
MKNTNIHIETTVRRLLADTLTPVALYLRLRDRFASPLLLESTDYHSRENCFSFICLEPLAKFIVHDGVLRKDIANAPSEIDPITAETDIPSALQSFMQRFQTAEDSPVRRFNGFYGHTNYGAVQHFETIDFTDKANDGEIPQMQYAFYRFVIAIDHFHDSLFLIENRLEGMAPRLPELEALVKSRNHGNFTFRRAGEETEFGTGEEFMDLVRKGKQYCQEGEVFQIVFSRRFAQTFEGDEFNVYRALRSVNPSPYLYFFDYGNYKLFGSSPEAQLQVSGGRARINPIAGTFRRTGDDEADRAAAKALSEDPKENAEHVMLVDLARNDLGRNARGIQVPKFREVQYFSHVIHLVSTVEGTLESEDQAVRVFADTFPAGTLSGAPKYRAMQLIDQHEPVGRGYYGGAIGMFGLDGSVNHAIMIRSFMSRNNQLFFQAGAGIVVAS